MKTKTIFVLSIVLNFSVQSLAFSNETCALRAERFYEQFQIEKCDANDTRGHLRVATYHTPEVQLHTMMASFIRSNPYVQWAGLWLTTGVIYASFDYLIFVRLNKSSFSKADYCKKTLLSAFAVGLKQAFDGLINFHAENTVPSAIHDQLEDLTKSANRDKLQPKQDVKQALESKIERVKKLGQYSRAIQGASALHGRDLLATMHEKSSDVALRSFEEFQSGKAKTSAKIIADFIVYVSNYYYEFDVCDEIIRNEFLYWWNDHKDSPIEISQEFVREIKSQLQRHKDFTAPDGVIYQSSDNVLKLCLLDDSLNF